MVPSGVVAVVFSALAYITIMKFVTLINRALTALVD
jgi:hypothetical protein